MIFPTVENALLVAVDLQTKLMPAMSESESIIRRAGIMVQGAVELGVDIVVSEQYPKGLGNTVPEISAWLPGSAPVIEKNCFSVFGSPEFNTFLSSKKREVLIFTGVEMHVCMLQSVLDALSAGYEVIVVADAVGSRKNSDRDLALEMARSAGAAVLSSESVLFMLMRDSGNPHFKAISKLIK
ncbi:MAG: isochorismatase family protein [Lentisphaerae bacterium]|nr:isochorismatase family protein [Lentisphaerota bacterium]